MELLTSPELADVLSVCLYVQIWTLCRSLQMRVVILSFPAFSSNLLLVAGKINVAYLLFRRGKAVPERLSSCIVFACFFLHTWKDEIYPWWVLIAFCALSSALL